jgi:hypothetical protein
MEYTAGEAARVVGISVASVRGYSARFAQFLSPTASPGPGKHRVLTDDDLRVMRFVFHFTAQGESWDDVAASRAGSLRAGARIYGARRSSGLGRVLAAVGR